MKAFLDSSVIIDFLKGDTAVEEIIKQAKEVYTSSLCAYEVLLGEAYSESKGRPAQYSRTRRFFDTITTLPFTSQDALCASGLTSGLTLKGKKVSEFDSLIAAQALMIGATLITKDAHFNVIKEETKQEVLLL